MPGLLPAILVAACVAALASRASRRGEEFSRRDAIVLSLLLAALWGAAAGEILGAVRSLRFWPVVLWWGGPSAFLIAAVCRSGAPALRPLVAPCPRPDAVTATMLAGVGVALLTTGLIALLTPPNTWDAAGYHMPRQVRWIEQASLAHFPANDLRQLEFPPLAENLGAQLMILVGGDALSNMIQWAAYAACILLASAIARDLGAAARGQALAALLAATIPAAINHAVNVKNDLLLAFWVCAVAWLLLRVHIEGACTLGRAALIGGAMGLLVYTHGAGYLFAVPLACLMAATMLQRLGARAVPLALGAAIVGAAVNAGHWHRNAAAFGHPLGRSAAGRGYTLANETLSPGGLASGIVRNLAIHSGTPSDAINAAQMRGVEALHAWFGIDASDPRTTTPPGRRFAIRWALAEDAHGGAPVHVLLGLLVPMAVAARNIKRPQTGAHGWVLTLSCTAWAMFLLFATMLKWQPWHARLHTTILMLLAPPCGAALPLLPGAAIKGAWPALAGLLAAGALIGNVCKPLEGDRSILRVSREETLFHEFAPALDAARRAAGAVAAYRPGIVAIEPGPDIFEYPLQRLLLDRVDPLLRFAPVRKGIGPPPVGPYPEVALVWDATSSPLTVRDSGPCYFPVAQFPPLTVYARADLAGAHRQAQIEETLPFSGWEESDGLGDAIGPFPQWEVPVVVRCGLGLSTRLRFTGADGGAELVMECRRGPSLGQGMRVFLNGEQVYSHAFDSSRRFSLHRVTLAARSGPNEVEIRYATTDRMPGGEERAVLFRRLQIAPSSIDRSAGPP